MVTGVRAYLNGSLQTGPSPTGGVSRGTGDSQAPPWWWVMGLGAAFPSARARTLLSTAEPGGAEPWAQGLEHCRG